jgi:multiple sugar transport system substrate-binding protein
MKKAFRRNLAAFIVLSLGLCLALIFSSCGGGAPAPAGTSATASEAPSQAEAAQADAAQAEAADGADAAESQTEAEAPAATTAFAAPAPDPAPAPASGEDAASYDGKSIRISWWGNDVRTNMTNEIIDAFVAKYPGLKAEVEYSAFGDYFTKLNTQAAGGQLPDVMQMDYSKIVPFAESGLILNLNGYIDSGRIDLEGIGDTMVSGGLVNGGMYGIATGVNAPCMLYDPQVLEDAGVTLGMSPTWTEVYEVSKAVLAATGIKNAILGIGWENYIDLYARSLGGSLYAPDGKSVGYTADMLTALWDLQLTAIEEGVAPEPGEYSGEVASIIGNKASWMIDAFTNQLAPYNVSNGDMQLAMCEYPVPEGAIRPHTYLKPTMFWSVAATSGLQDLSADFLNYFTNDGTVFDVCGTDRGMPISPAVREYLAPKASEEDRQIGAYLDYLADGHSSPIDPPAPAVMSEVYTEYLTVFEQMSYRQYSHDELPGVTQSLIEKMNGILRDAAAAEQ